ncbi:MAG: AraC family transcriptional regulator [Rikenellaceae bacterium]
MNNVINEISPLLEKDCFYIVERYKNEFTYPIHRHKEYELNFIENGAGLSRVVGDSIETVSNYDLVLIGCENLEHAWEQGECGKTEPIREITIQFSSDIFSDSLLFRNQFDSIRKMLERSKRGLSFPLNSIMKIYSLLDTVSSIHGFDQFMTILRILYELSKCDSNTLCNSSFAKVEQSADSRRVTKIENYIRTHYMEPIKLNTLSDLVGMTPPAFSRFFKLRTGSNLSEYITGIRLGAASRLLVDSTMSISEVCYECGFNNISNFNRIFKKQKKLTPKEFREVYHKKRIIC